MNDDLGPNKARLFCTSARAVPGDVLVDLGVREGASSMTMLEATAGQGCSVIGVDPCEKHPLLDDPRYYYLKTDSVTAAQMINGPLYLCFFDTLHIKEQVMAELFHYWPKIRVGGFAVFHDSEWPADKHDYYLDREWGQVIEGINAFFAEAGEHIIRVHYPEEWGMTFVKKLDDWNPTVPGMLDALVASRELTKHVCGI